MAKNTDDYDTWHGSSPEGLPVSPSLTPALDAAQVPPQSSLVDRRILYICVLATVLGICAAFIAQALMYLIALITNVCFHGVWSFEDTSPVGNHLGLWVIGVPVIGGLIVGVMARYGSKAIRGHGIPEAMETILTSESRIPARVTLLKPLSSAIAIGTGGPFGAEGPIIATGGALGSVIGQVLSITAIERKTLLAAGAAAGMAATFGSPVAAVFLAIELLLFEYRPRSFIPVAFASAAAAGMRIVFEGVEPVFAMPPLENPAGAALAAYILFGAIMGVFAVYVTKAVYWVEDAFEELPIHWMWWPAIGAVAVGVIGYFVPRTLGVGYENISAILTGNYSLQFIAILCVTKFASWAIALGSGTSGGTLAPLFTIGGALGALLGAGTAALFPAWGVSPSVAALVGMAAIFAGSSRALLASAIFAFETTLQPLGLLPLLGGCTAAYLVSCLLMRQTIMTEKIVRRGIRVPAEYAADVLDQVHVRDVASPEAITIQGQDTLDRIRDWINSELAEAHHHACPVVNEEGVLLGVLTRRNLFDAVQPAARRAESLIKRPPVIVYDDCTLRQAVDHMVNHRLGLLPVIRRNDPGRLVGVITRSDVLSAYRRRLDDSQRDDPSINLPMFRFRRRQEEAEAEAETQGSESR